MLNRRALFLGLTIMPLTAAAAAAAETLAGLFARYVAPGPDGVARVSYGRWAGDAADRRALADAIATLTRAPAAGAPAPVRFAAWANLYNALTVSVVLDHYPIRSIRDVKSHVSGIDLKALIGPWREKRVIVGDRHLSLDDIENAILRREFHDPRVHYALNCASIGCPNLRAWQADALDADLESAARAYINHPRGVTASPGGLRLSSIFDWFADDFGGKGAGVRAHLERYAEPALREAIRTMQVSGYEYDWALNDAVDAKGRG